MDRTDCESDALRTTVSYVPISASTSVNVDTGTQTSECNWEHFDADREKKLDRRRPRRLSTKLSLNADPPMIRRYASNRWRIFADYTTLHGVKEIYKAPLRKLKILWLVILTLCAAIMLFQICKLTAHFLAEPVTTTVTAKHEFYELPLFLLVAHTHELFSREQMSRAKQGLDAEALYYAKSLVDKKVELPDGYDFDRGRRKFDAYLASHPGVTWHDALEPYLHDLSAWIGADDNLRVRRRSMWNIATYHLLEPVESHTSPRGLTHDLIVEVPLSWASTNSLPITDDGPASLVLTSYGLLTDAIRLEAGHIYKIRFEMTSQRSVNLRRKTCLTGYTQYSMYDQQMCNETCLAEAERQYAPRKCYDHSLYEWGFSELYSFMRPCSYGFSNSSGGPFSVERSGLLEGASEEKMRSEYEKCFYTNCLPACEQLSVKFSTTTREFGNDLKNRSLLFVTWPAASAVPVYDEALQYTWDGFVGQLGGLIGLWMGASMMSAFEALYLCCCCCYDVVGDEEYEDEERTYGMGKRRAKGGHKSSAGGKAECVPYEYADAKNGFFSMDDMTRNEIWLPRTIGD